MSKIDLRVIRVSLEINGQLKVYEGLNIAASGSKYANANQNDCEVKISNLDKETSDYLLTQTSPFNLNKTPKSLYLYAGRESYGVALIYSGNITSATLSQPPDTTITLKCLTGNYLKGNVVARNQGSSATLKQISQGVAADTGTILDFQASDKNISNYSFYGGTLKQVDRLNDLGQVNAYIDDGKLVVKNSDSPVSPVATIVSEGTGMVGIPELTEQGIRVKFLLDGKTSLGGLLRVISIKNPAADGDYLIYKLSFEIASRDTPFYWIAEGKRISQ